MKKNVLILSVVIFIIGVSFLSIDFNSITYITNYKKNHTLNANGAPAGRTGAPGEANCSSCHTGTVTQNSTINELQIMKDGNLVNEYVPGTTYDVFLTINNSAIKKGFQNTVRIVSSNQTAGQLQAVSPSTAYLTSGAKQYINHTSSSNTSTSPFQFKWTAPSDDVGEIKFYIASNVSNNNGNDSGDLIHLSQHSINYNNLSPKITFNTENINICEGEQILFNNFSTQGDNLTYSWVFDGGLPNLSTEEFPLITYSQAGTYNVSVSITNSVGTYTKEVNNMITVNSCSNIKENTTSPFIKFDKLNNEIKIIFQDEITKIKISNSEGRVYYYNNYNNIINTNKLKRGLYFIEIHTLENVWLKKVIID